MKRVLLFSILCTTSLLIYFFYVRIPIITGSLTKQTIYLSFLNSFHCKNANAEPCFMLIDDDSGIGIFKIHEICERIGIKATFAVVPATLDSTRCNALKIWRQEGYSIALHSYNHGRWKDWETTDIVSDIKKSLVFLEKNDIASKDDIKIVVTPGFYNTNNIRKAIYSQNYKMVMGANIVNPDTTTFQWGRLFITKDTDIFKIQSILERAKKESGFIILGTHSSNSNEFSAEKTEEILRMVVKLGFKTYQ